MNDALDLVNQSVKDWSGGTKIGKTLETFNQIWARRVLTGGAVVLIISDGWDTGNIELGSVLGKLDKRQSFRAMA